MGKNSFILYHDYEEHFDLLTNEQKGMLITAVFQYSKTGKKPNFDHDGALMMSFSFIKAALDRDKEKYEKKCKKNAENIKRRWEDKTVDTTVYDRIQSNTTVYDYIPSDTNYTDNDMDNDNENDIDIYSLEEKTSGPAVVTLPLNDKTEYPIYAADVLQWESLYPAVDVMQELRKMRGWCLSNPKRRKTKSGIKKFINSWLSREQDKYTGEARSPYPAFDQHTLSYSEQIQREADKLGVTPDEFKRIAEERRNC